MPTPKQMRKAIAMITGEEVLGRVSAGWDVDNTFDVLPPMVADFTEADVQNAELFTGEDEIETGPFEGEETFPEFSKALSFYQEQLPKNRVARIDTDKSHDKHVSRRAFEELAKRVTDLRSLVEAHLADHHGPKVPGLEKWDEILGAADVLASHPVLEAPKSAIPGTVPDDLKHAVDCYEDGGAVIVMMRFGMPDGSSRTATTASRPSMADEETLLGWAEEHGLDPVTVLGAMPAATKIATGKRLVSDLAHMALEAREREDVQDMDDSPVLVFGAEDTSAPIAALMHLEQQANAGNAQAAHELAVLRAASLTPIGQKVAAPLLAEASRRLAAQGGK